MVFTIAVGIGKTINFSYTIRPALSTCPFYMGFRPTVLGSSFCITTKFLRSSIIYYDIKNVIVTQKLEARTMGLKPT